MATATLPPGPPWRALQAVNYFRNPYSMLRNIAQRYGDLFTVRTARVCVMTGKPDYVRQIVGAPADQYGVNLERGPRRVLGDRGMAQLAGHELRRDRKLIVPQFQGGILPRLAGMIQDATLEVMQSWRPGEEMKLREPALAMALDVIIRTIFGGDTTERREEFRAAVREFSLAFGSPGFLLLAILRVDIEALPPFRRFAAARAHLEHLLQQAMERARADGPERGDILAKLVAVTYDDGSHLADAALRDNLITTLIAGHETSVVSLCWAVFWLHRHPDCLAKVLDELAPLGAEADPAAYARLPYLDAVVKETLRLYPVVTDINRVLAKPMRLGAYELPPGTTVAGATAILHYDPELYPEPDSFRPERFLERRFAPYEYTPFGGGERMCPGSQFSPFELKVMLATLLTRARLTLLDPPGPPPVSRQGAMMGPSSGVRIRYDGPR